MSDPEDLDDGADGEPSGLPAWFEQGVLAPFQAGIATVFVLHGDVHGLVANHDADDEPDKAYLSLRGFLEKVENTKRYRLTPRLLVLGAMSVTDANIFEKSIDVMRRLRDATGETALLGTLAGVTWALVGGFAVYGLLGRFVGLRLSQEEEFDGADLSIHKIGSTPEHESSW